MFFLLTLLIVYIALCLSVHALFGGLNAEFETLSETVLWTATLVC